MSSAGGIFVVVLRAPQESYGSRDASLAFYLSRG